MDTVTPTIGASPLEDTIKKVSDALVKHEREDEVWKVACDVTHKQPESQPYQHTPSYEHKEVRKMGMDNISDKVNINVGDGGGRGGYDGGAGLAAVIAALGNRNQGNDNAALIAALGNRNDDSSQWAPMMTMMADRRHDGCRDGFGGDGAWPLILLALLGRRGGGLFGGDDCGGGGDAVNQITLNEVLSKLGTLEGQVPLVGSQVQNSILEQTNAIQSTLNQNNIAQLVAHTNTKDAVTNTGAILLNQANQNTQAILQAVAAVGTKIDTNTIADLQRQLAVSQSREAEERHHARVRDVEVNVSQQVTQAQAQAQFQQQQQDILRHFAALAGQINVIGNQVARTGQDVVNVGGLMTGTTQTANPVNVK